MCLHTDKHLNFNIYLPKYMYALKIWIYMFACMHFNFLIILLYHRLAAPQTGEHNSYANKSDLKSTVISVKVNRNLIENLPANNYGNYNGNNNNKIIEPSYKSQSFFVSDCVISVRSQSKITASLICKAHFATFRLIASWSRAVDRQYFWSIVYLLNIWYIHMYYTNSL